MYTHHVRRQVLKPQSNNSISDHPSSQWMLLRAFIFFAVACVSALAAVPPNDTCSGAIVMASPGDTPSFAPPVDITQATSIGDPTMLPDCQTLVTQSVWYVFTPTNTEFYTVSSCSTLTQVGDTVLGLYTSSAGCSDPSQFELLACSDDSGGDCYQKAAITTEFQSGVTYYIILWRYSGTAMVSGNTNVQLYISKTLPPVNDICANAQVLTLNVPLIGSTLAANNDYELVETSCFTGLGQEPTTTEGRDVVYSFMAPATGAYSIKVYNYSPDPNELVIYAASECPSGDAPQGISGCLAAANRVIYGTAEELFCLSLAEGQVIYIYVDEQFLTGGSNFTIEVAPCRQETEPNNTIASANSLLFRTQGSLRVRGDDDYYALGTFPAGSRAFAMLDGSAGAMTSFYLDLATATNLLETDTIDNSPGFGDQSGNIAGAILPAQPVYLRVYNYLLRGNEPYRLFAVVQPPLENAVVETEPNNNYWEPNSAANNYFRGVLATSSDVDVFSFDANMGDLVFLSLDCDPLRDLTPLNGKLELLDLDGKVLLNVDEINPTSFPPGEALVYQVAETGTYLARISISPDAGETDASGDYLLSISKNGYRGAGLNTAPLFGNLSIGAVSEGEPAILTGLVSDPDTGEGFQINVNWGDGSATVTNLVGVNAFSLPHVYLNNLPGGPPFGSYSISISARDNAGAGVTNETSVIVNNADPGVTLQLTANSIFENANTTLNGTVVDPGGLDEHTVTIDWADGSPLSVTNLLSGQTNFSMTHTYLDDSQPGTPWDLSVINVVVNDLDSGWGTNKVSLIINNIVPGLSNVIVTTPVSQHQAVTLQGSLGDAGPLDAFLLEVQWGDGTVQTNLLSSGSTQFSLQHSYLIGGTNLSIQVTLRDDDGGQVSTNVNLEILSSAQPQLSLSGSAGALSLRLQGTAGTSYRVQTTTNLTHWDEFTNLTINPVGYTDLLLPNTPGTRGRFYRALFP